MAGDSIFGAYKPPSSDPSTPTPAGSSAHQPPFGIPSGFQALPGNSQSHFTTPPRDLGFDTPPTSGSFPANVDSTMSGSMWRKPPVRDPGLESGYAYAQRDAAYGGSQQINSDPFQHRPSLQIGSAMPLDASEFWTFQNAAKAELQQHCAEIQQNRAEIQQHRAEIQQHRQVIEQLHQRAVTAEVTVQEQSKQIQGLAASVKDLEAKLATPDQAPAGAKSKGSKKIVRSPSFNVCMPIISTIVD